MRATRPFVPSGAVEAARRPITSSMEPQISGVIQSILVLVWKTPTEVVASVLPLVTSSVQTASEPTTVLPLASSPNTLPVAVAAKAPEGRHIPKHRIAARITRKAALTPGAMPGQRRPAPRYDLPRSIAHASSAVLVLDDDGHFHVRFANLILGVGIERGEYS